MASESHVLGVDIGTGGCKLCVVDAGGQVAGEVSVSYPTGAPRPGWMEQDPTDWIDALVRGTRTVLSDTSISASQIAGLAFSCAAHIGVLLDDVDRPLRPAILWSDQRSAQEVAGLGLTDGLDAVAHDERRGTRRFTPDAAHVQIYERQFLLYQKIQQELAPLYEASAMV